MTSRDQVQELAEMTIGRDDLPVEWTDLVEEWKAAVRMFGNDDDLMAITIGSIAERRGGALCVGGVAEIPIDRRYFAVIGRDWTALYLYTERAAVSMLAKVGADIVHPEVAR